MSEVEAIAIPRNNALVLARALKVLAVPCNHPLHECEHEDECSHDFATRIVKEMSFPLLVVKS